MRLKRNDQAKLSKAEIFSFLADIVCAESVGKAAPAFPRRFRVFLDDKGRRHLLEENLNQVVVARDEQSLASEILRFCRDHLVRKCTQFNLTNRDATEAARYVINVMKPLDREPALVRFASEDGLTYARLSFDPVRGSRLDDCPLWFEISNRMSNFEAFCMRIGSIFDPFADRKQAIYVHGQKDSGKSQIQMCLAGLCGESYAVLGSSDFKTAFWKAALIGKRVLMLPEADPKFLSCDEFKSLTGDGLHSVNEKGIPIRKAMLSVLLFFFSNKPPQVHNDSAVIERVIECKMNPVDRDRLIPEFEYQASLTKEFPAFIGFCLDLYEQKCGKGRRIPCSYESITALAQEKDAEAIELFDRLFIVDPAGRISRGELFTIVNKNVIVDNREYNFLIRTWKRLYGISCHRISEDSGEPAEKVRPFYWFGLRQRTLLKVAETRF